MKIKLSKVKGLGAIPTARAIPILAIVVQLQPAPKCETYAPRLDGTQVTVCDGRVTRVVFVGKGGK